MSQMSHASHAQCENKTKQNKTPENKTNYTKHVENVENKKKNGYLRRNGVGECMPTTPLISCKSNLVGCGKMCEPIV